MFWTTSPRDFSRRVPCEQKFLSCMAFSVYEVVRVACLPRSWFVYSLWETSAEPWEISARRVPDGRPGDHHDSGVLINFVDIMLCS